MTTCTHPDHNENKTCEDRAVGCSKHCVCCMGVLTQPDDGDSRTLTSEATLKTHTRAMNQTTISFTPESLLRFTAAFNASEKHSTFQFDGNWFVPDYARYLIEYAAGELGMRFQLDLATGEISVR